MPRNSEPPAVPSIQRWRLRVTGVVQGVGFRPFVYGIAVRHGLAGCVSNDSEGVTIELEGSLTALDEFEQSLLAELPPLAQVDSVARTLLPPQGSTSFAIVESHAIAGVSTPIPADIATCDQCLAELFDLADRRYRYPFLNCTNCGPRFTIIQDIPYDRPLTTMAGFSMCPDCAREYHDPANRRFHAQPVACPACGPQLSWEPGCAAGSAALAAAQQALREGRIVAVKGIGGFHLACDAGNEDALGEMRRRKGRVGKPFALMARSLDVAARYVELDADETRLLQSPQRPILLLRQRADSPLPDLVAPGQQHLGFVLPYAPLHHLLLEGLFPDDRPLVMTSGNLTDEPIARTNNEARQRLAAIADGFLLHNREIHAVCDDSVVRVFAGRELPIRRSRGYAPLPVRLSSGGPAVLATGGELKATLCVTRGNYAYLSQHIGDMANLETMEAFERACANLQGLFRVTPERIICDLHPGYLSTTWAVRYGAGLGLPLVQVQHHHAHIAAVMAERGLREGAEVLGLSFDGTGYGTDGAIWGGELLRAGYTRFERLGHLKYVPIPGGDAAIRSPYRMAMAHLWAAGLAWEDSLAPVREATEQERNLLLTQLQRGLNCPSTSSMGRLFDAAAALAGLCQRATYEGQGAMEFEAAAHGEIESGYELALIATEAGVVFDPACLWQALIEDVRRGVEVSRVSARFHHAVAELGTRAVRQASEATGIRRVALSGGVFQNTLLLGALTHMLECEGFEVLTHRLVPPNDGGISLGQAVIGRAMAVAGLS
jgi:hydrogenase maturation protein HypF